VKTNLLNLNSEGIWDPDIAEMQRVANLIIATVDQWVISVGSDPTSSKFGNQLVTAHASVLV